jgi:CMP-2-keto-3-deoxyoctulosonic acid synthetase
MRKARMLERRYDSVRVVKKRLLAHLSKLAICHAFGDSAAAAIERLTIAEELEKIAAAVSG